MCRSTELSNFVVFTSLTSVDASLREYALLLSTLVFATFLFFVIIVYKFEVDKLVFPWSFSFNCQTHAACSTSNHAHGALQGESIQIRHFIFSDIFYLCPGYFTNFYTIWFLTSALEFSGVQQLYSCRRSFDDKLEGFVSEDGD